MQTLEICWASRYNRSTGRDGAWGLSFSKLKQLEELAQLTGSRSFGFRCLGLPRKERFRNQGFKWKEDIDIQHGLLFVGHKDYSANCHRLRPLHKMV